MTHDAVEKATRSSERKRKRLFQELRQTREKLAENKLMLRALLKAWTK